MKHLKRRKILFILSVCTLIFVCLFFYFMFTAKGSAVVVKYILSGYFDSSSVEVAQARGTLKDRLIFTDIEIENLKGLPEGSRIKIQKLSAALVSLSPDGLDVNIENGRLLLSQSDPVLFYGRYSGKLLDVEVYSKEVGLPQVFDMFSDSPTLRNVTGLITEIDARVTGSLDEPELKGTLTVNSLQLSKASLKNAPASFDIRLKDIKDDIKFFGQIVFSAGEVALQKSTVKLQESRMLFDGNIKRPSFDVKGTAKVADTEIHVVFRGGLKDFDLRLTSSPPQTQTKLMLMLITGKSWQNTESALENGQVSAGMATDFIDYFFFGGAGNSIAGYLGLDSIQIKAGVQQKGIGIEKSISDKTVIGYEVEQTTAVKETDATTSQKIKAEHQITDSVSVQAEKEFKNTENVQDAKEDVQADDKVLIKYKKQF